MDKDSSTEQKTGQDFFLWSLTCVDVFKVCKYKYFGYIIQTEGSYELMNDCRGIPRHSK